MPHVILQLLPAEVLRKANALARALERDQFFRSYVVRRIWIIFPVVFIGMFVMAGILFEAGALVMRWLWPVAAAIRYGIGALGVVLWFAGTLLVIYWVLSSMERTARRAQEESPAPETASASSAERGPQAGPARRWPVRTIVVTSIVLVVAIAAANWMLGSAYAERRVKAACARIQAGMPFTELEEIAARHALLAPGSASGTVYLADRSSFSRHACKVTLEQGVVKHSEYNHPD